MTIEFHFNRRRLPGVGEGSVLTLACVPLLGALGCASAIKAQVNAVFEQQRQFNEAVKYERWDTAVELAEGACKQMADASSAQKPTFHSMCASERLRAYGGRAAQKANAGDFDGAVADERRVSAAVDDEASANSEEEASQRDLGVPAIAMDSIVAQHLQQSTREREKADAALAAYQRHQLPGAAGRQAIAPVPPPPPPGLPSPVSATAPAPGFIAASPQGGSFAFIVGVEGYRDIPPATGAHGDAMRFAQLVRQTLGLRDDHVRLAIDDHATRADILSGLAWLSSTVPAGGRIYFFYGGHGAPSPDQSTYLVPYDGDIKSINISGVSVAEVLRSLSTTKAHDVLAIVDACFSGAGGRSVLPPGARPLIRVKDPAPNAQVALFSASGGDEISGLAPGENSGLFTKEVTTGLGTGQADADGDGQITLQELSDWVAPRVAREAKTAGREQHPKLIVGAGIASAASMVVEYGLPTK